MYVSYNPGGVEAQDHAVTAGRQGLVKP